MNDFLEKWKNDKKYQTKIKLLLYTLFVVIVAIYAISSNDSSDNLDNQNNDMFDQVLDVNNNPSEEQNNTSNDESIIKIPEEYDYDITININNQISRYYGTKDNVKTTISKYTNEKLTNYIYEDESYYVESEETYTLTTKEAVYDVINYNYINLENINKYLNEGTLIDNQYNIYLKDIILGNDSEEYFTIIIDDEINIDYTNMMKYFDDDIEEYKVKIKIEERNKEVN